MAIRPERNPRLVSYPDPDYTKYAQNGNDTAFRHIDLNITKYLELGARNQNITGVKVIERQDRGRVHGVYASFPCDILINQLLVQTVHFTMLSTRAPSRRKAAVPKLIGQELRL